MSKFNNGARISSVIEINTSNDIKLSPKVLIVNPKSRLSWQYHYRRNRDTGGDYYFSGVNRRDELKAMSIRLEFFKKLFSFFKIRLLLNHLFSFYILTIVSINH